MGASQENRMAADIPCHVARCFLRQVFFYKSLTLLNKYGIDSCINLMKKVTFFLVNAMKVCGSGVYLHSFLTSALCGG
jgi:hypothetical protein